MYTYYVKRIFIVNKYKNLRNNLRDGIKFFMKIFKSYLLLLFIKTI